MEAVLIPELKSTAGSQGNPPAAILESDLRDDHKLKAQEYQRGDNTEGVKVLRDENLGKEPGNTDQEGGTPGVIEDDTLSNEEGLKGGANSTVTAGSHIITIMRKQKKGVQEAQLALKAQQPTALKAGKKSVAQKPSVCKPAVAQKSIYEGLKKNAELTFLFSARVLKKLAVKLSGKLLRILKAEISESGALEEAVGAEEFISRALIKKKRIQKTLNK